MGGEKWVCLLWKWNAIVKKLAQDQPAIALWGDLEACAMINQTRKKVISLKCQI
jgi:hypothetical protein